MHCVPGMKRCIACYSTFPEGTDGSAILHVSGRYTVGRVKQAPDLLSSIRSLVLPYIWVGEVLNDSRSPGCVEIRCCTLEMSNDNA